MPTYHRQKVREATRKPRALATSSAKWRRIRARVLRLNPECSACPRPATEVDHVDNDSTNNHSTNLVQYCKQCHSRKTYHRDGLGNLRGGPGAA